VKPDILLILNLITNQKQEENMNIFIKALNIPKSALVTDAKFKEHK